MMYCAGMFIFLLFVYERKQNKLLVLFQKTKKKGLAIHTFSIYNMTQGKCEDLIQLSSSPNISSSNQHHFSLMLSSHGIQMISFASCSLIV